MKLNQLMIELDALSTPSNPNPIVYIALNKGDIMSDIERITRDRDDDIVIIIKPLHPRLFD